MLTCVYQPPLPLSKNSLLKLNRDSKKVIVSKFSEEKGGKVKVEIAPNHQDTSLPETCGLSISELETMAARQARQLETQEQLLAAKAQRLRFLKSGGEAERLHRLRDKVATQEDRLRKLRALRGKVHNNRGANAALSSDLESLRAVFNEKEKELTVAVAKVEDLTRQLDDLRRGGKEPTSGQSAAAVELEKLRRELMYRQKLREAQATRVAAQKVALSQRQDEAMRIDRRIAELQERLHRKRLLNHQLAVTLKHQESVDDFVSVPSKNDPKYQTLPYNAKLFAPFANKHDRDNFEKSVQQMQIMHLDSQQPSQQQLDQQQQYHVQQQQHQQQHQQSNKSNQILNYPSNNNNLQLHHLISQNQHNAKSANHPLPQQLSAPSLSQHQAQQQHQQQQQQQSQTQSSSPVPPSNASVIPNGVQNVHNALGNNANMSWGKVISTGANNSSHTNENIFPFARPSTFGPTGAPASNNNLPPSSTPSGLPLNNQLVGTNETSGSNASVTGSDGYAPAGHNNGGLNIISGVPGRQAKPALPPKPAKPTPPPRGQGMQDIFSFNQRLPSSEREGSVGALSVMPDRTELPIKPKPLFIKKGNQSSSVSTSSSNTGSAVNTGEKEQSSGNNNTAVRVSINRRIEMPPAFLFPESDPPPSDLIPEHPSAPSAGSGVGDRGQQQLQSQQQTSATGESSGSPHDETDASALQKAISHPEEYTLPDLFPHPPGHVVSNNNLMNSGFNNLKNSNMQNNNMVSNLLNSNASSTVSSSNNCPSNSELINNNNNILKEYKDSFFANLNQQTMGSSAGSFGHSNSTSTTTSNLSSTTSSTMNNVNLIRATNINSGSNPMTDSSVTQGEKPVNTDDHQRQQYQQQQLQLLDLENLNHVSVMSIQVSESSPTGDSKMDLSPIQLESYEVGNESAGTGIDHSGDRDEVASDSANSGSTITTTTSSVSSGSGVNVLRRVKKGNLKSNNKDHVPLGRRVSFDPLALLLDASLEGELDLVVKTAGEVGNASAANDEGITALHNAICAGHAEVVRFLVEFGCDVNAQDSDGWTPLHCAASCNNVGMVKFLVERGACIFATTLSDHETAAEKCEEDEDGFGPCSEYLYSIQEKLGIMNGGVVYAVFEYDAQNPDELTFRDGDRLMILRKGDEYEREWWWASLGDKQGYVPRNLLGLYPRVVPHKRNES